MATHLINRWPCQTSGTVTPFQLLLGEPPSYNHLHVFGCLCYPNQTVTTPHKLSARSTPCAFIGYPSDHRGHRCLDLRTCRVTTSLHVVFDETQFPFLSEQMLPAPTTARSATVSDDTVILPTTAAPRRVTPPHPSPTAPRIPNSTPSSTRSVAQ